ncbi:hypothetical protein UY416_03215 [Paenibacillus polymyxa]|uniref:hypothetical protein n=1 Tax=Paenibacillus polymyxa TaxID=1406 RepID=UPI002AB3374A|nr:hypothetical protein [Paenibacillus polymyxa]MDY8045300.1 hypothetical protein [Paenibacillus polymyxa]
MDNKILQIGRLVYISEKYSADKGLRRITESMLSSTTIQFFDMDLVYGFYMQTLDEGGEILHKNKVIEIILNYIK